MSWRNYGNTAEACHSSGRTAPGDHTNSLHDSSSISSSVLSSPTQPTAFFETESFQHGNSVGIKRSQPHVFLRPGETGNTFERPIYAPPSAVGVPGSCEPRDVDDMDVGDECTDHNPGIDRVSSDSRPLSASALHPKSAPQFEARSSPCALAVSSSCGKNIAQPQVIPGPTDEDGGTRKQCQECRIRIWKSSLSQKSIKSDQCCIACMPVHPHAGSERRAEGATAALSPKEKGRVNKYGSTQHTTRSTAVGVRKGGVSLSARAWAHGDNRFASVAGKYTAGQNAPTSAKKTSPASADNECKPRPSESSRTKRVREEESVPVVALSPNSAGGSSAPVRETVRRVPVTPWSGNGKQGPMGTSSSSSSRSSIVGGLWSGGVDVDAAGVPATGAGREPHSKRGKANRSESSPSQSSALVATRPQYQIVHHRAIAPQGDNSAQGIGTIELSAGAGATFSLGYGSPTLKDAKTRGRYQSHRKDSNPRREGRGPSNSKSSSAKAYSPKSRVSATLEVADPVNSTTSSLVVIDGSNVAFSYRQDVSNPRWSPQGVLLAIEFFEQRGMQVVAFVPRPRVDGISPEDEHYDAFMQAVRSQSISMVPSNGNDDLFILLYAIQRSAHIVSNDQFRDHLKSSSTLASLGLTQGELKTFLAHHHVCYTFARDEFIANPEAPIIKMLTQQASDRRRRGQDN